jgi:LAS superfamily LD-carboxypeptidase LdcB
MAKNSLKKIALILSASIVALIPLALISYSETVVFIEVQPQSLQTLSQQLFYKNSTVFEVQPQNLDQVYEQIDRRKSEASQNQSAYQTLVSYSWAEYPESIKTVTRDPNDLLVLVNKKYQLPSTYSPSDLVSLESTGLRLTKSGLYMRSVLISDLTQLVSDIKDQGIDIAVTSAYRSYQTQQSTYNYWVAYNNGSTAAADTISARPGHSQHQLGTAIDFTTSQIKDQLGQQFAETPAGIWLAQNAWKYGFVMAYPQGYENITGYSFEPWHFRYIGKENASAWHSSGQILEVWLRGINNL